MNKANFVQKGETIDVTNSSTTTKIGYGEIVSLNTRVGVAAAPIEASSAGAVHVTGVFEFPKATGAVTLGQALYYDATNDVMTTAEAGNIPAGWAVAAAASADANVRMQIGAVEAAEAGAVKSAVVLKAPNGDIYDVTVSNAGSLTATKRT